MPLEIEISQTNERGDGVFTLRTFDLGQLFALVRFRRAGSETRLTLHKLANANLHSKAVILDVQSFLQPKLRS